MADLAQNRIDRGVVAGTPEEIADQLSAWQDAGIDGINVLNWRLPDTYVEFNERLLPALQKRGLAKQAYEPGTLRKKIFGHDRLPENHPGTVYRSTFGTNGSAGRAKAVAAGE